ncbi:MAG: SMI1/KNR4 family protein [Planctomycetes bacterium]|nr:SMI1/KNR4 family protein [Planctomycetota bacterium]
MGKWRTLFESSLPPAEQREHREEYEFGPPATAEQIVAAERALGGQLPADVREMLSEFNGVWRRTHFDGGRRYREIHYLDTQHMSVDVPSYFASCGNPLPPRYALRRVVFVAQSNGYGDLWGVCVADVVRHKAGAVVRLDHEVGRLEAWEPTLAEFVRAGLRDRGSRPAFAPTEGKPTADLPGLRERRDRPSFAGWEGTHPPDLVAQAETAITGLIDRLIALGPTPSEQQVRAEIDGCIRAFDDLQWSRGASWIDAREQADICDALHEAIDLSGFEASDEWTSGRDW